MTHIFSRLRSRIHTHPTRVCYTGFIPDIMILVIPLVFKGTRIGNLFLALYERIIIKKINENLSELFKYTVN